MAPPSPRHDGAAGAGVAAWVTGMGIVLASADVFWRVTGAVMWGAGLVAAAGVAAHAYVTRTRNVD
ncbi:hypothetical protein ACIQLJ_08965 [Microbacterium sp. NPDC091313]